MQTGNLDTLYMVGYASIELPSWVPDWSNECVPAPLELPRFGYREIIHSFSANKGLCFSQALICDDEKRLILQGVKVEVVDMASLEITMVIDSAYSTIVDLLPQFINTIIINSLYPTGEDVQEVFALTLTAGRGGKRELLSDKAAHLNNFNAYLNKCYKITTEPWSLGDNLRFVTIALVMIYAAVFDFEGMIEVLRSPIPLAILSSVPAIYFVPIIIRNTIRWWHIYKLKRNTLYSGLSYFPPKIAETEDFTLALFYGCHHRAFFTTPSGYFGIGPWTMRPGDFVVILCDGIVPFVLREEGDEFRLVGSCYMHGFMFGEFSERLKESDQDIPSIQSFVIH